MNKRAYFKRYITKADEKNAVFNPTPLQAVRAHTIINECIFGKKLTRPKIIIQHLEDAWGICHGDLDDGKYPPFDPCCNYIALNNSFYNWRYFVEVLAHEMVHQYQIEYHNKLDHGKTFWAWKEKFERYNLHLQISYGRPRTAKCLKSLKKR
jgi:hypothetical protein